MHSEAEVSASATGALNSFEFRLVSNRRQWIVRVRRRPLEDRLMRKLGCELPRRLEFRSECQCLEACGAAAQLASHLCELSVLAPGVLAFEDVRAQYSQTLMELLLHALTHNYSDSSAGRQDPVQGAHRVQQYIDTHIAEIQTVRDVANALSVSTRTVQLWFRSTFNTCPAEYIRHARLTALHQALLAAEASCSVTDVMASVGIVSCGRYAEYYRRMFGEFPSSSLVRAGRPKGAHRPSSRN
jgi:AraC-like DNA-binding protein